MIADTYQNWRQGKEYEDIQGFCKVMTLEEIFRVVGQSNPGEGLNFF